MNVKYIKTLLSLISSVMSENREKLIEMDSVVGDGDLGLTMSDGFKAAYGAVENSDETDIGKMLYFAGKAMSTAVPSTMGTLMASGLMNAGKVLKGRENLDNKGLYELFKAYEDGVANRGKAKVGEKTFLDGLHPAVEALSDSDKPLYDLAKDAYNASKEGYENTSSMLAVHGRAATRGEASRTLKDPGAYVATLIMEAFLKSVV